jgi:L-lactate dehydrogenase complex protein LldG
MAAVRRALGPLAASPSDRIESDARALLDAPERVRPRLPEGSPLDLFLAAVRRLPPGASAEIVPDAASVPGAVARHLAALGLPPAAKIQPAPMLAALDWRGAGVEPATDADDAVAVTLAERGVAETGSLLARSGPRSAVLDWILPLHHVAVLRAADVVPHLEDAFGSEALREARNLVLVTGPSGTTDIEGSLVIGVHGPRTVHVVVVRDA